MHRHIPFQQVLFSTRYKLLFYKDETFIFKSTAHSKRAFIF